MRLVLMGVAQIAKAVLGQSGGFVEYAELSLFSLYDHIYYYQTKRIEFMFRYI
jgi:hypothetical protein